MADPQLLIVSGVKDEGPCFPLRHAVVTLESDSRALTNVFCIYVHEQAPTGFAGSWSTVATRLSRAEDVVRLITGKSIPANVFFTQQAYERVKPHLIGLSRIDLGILLVEG